jgi:hypothetical protein
MVLVAALTVAFASVLVVVPRYFETYNRMAMQASYSQELQGFLTSASLSRYSAGNGYVITIVIYNNGDDPVTVSYSITCEGPSGSYFVGKRDNVVISPHSEHHQVFIVSKSAISGMVCYATVEEPNLLIYKVLES